MYASSGDEMVILNKPPHEIAIVNMSNPTNVFAQKRKPLEETFTHMVEHENLHQALFNIGEREGAVRLDKYPIYANASTHANEVVHRAYAKYQKMVNRELERKARKLGEKVIGE